MLRPCFRRSLMLAALACTQLIGCAGEALEKAELGPASSEQRARARLERQARKRAFEEQGPRASSKPPAPKPPKIKPPPPAPTKSAEPTPPPQPSASASSAPAASASAVASAKPPPKPPIDPTALCEKICKRAFECAQENMPDGIAPEIRDGMQERMSRQCQTTCLEKAEDASEETRKAGQKCLEGTCSELFACLKKALPEPP